MVDVKVNFKSLYRYMAISIVIWTIIVSSSFIWNVVNERNQTLELAKNLR